MKIKATTLDAYNLLHYGTLVMAEMEQNGIRIDTKYIINIQKKIQKRIDQLTDELKQDKIFKLWKKVYGEKTKIGSREQLANILFGKMKIPCETKTKSESRYAADEETLEDTGLPFAKKYLQCEKLKTARTRYLANILRETSIGGYLHPNFNLNTVRSYRGSSDHPNFQNMPMRDALIKKLVRRAFIPRKGCYIVDLDFKGSEVNAASWYHKDPIMLDYINDSTKDMHRDMAQQIYKLPKELVTADIRHCGKNKFVFPQFYGDWWLSCSKYLWRAINIQKLKTADGMPLKKWLKKKGIPDFDTFAEHVKDVEEDFWFNRFKVYQSWKDKWWDSYREKGHFQMFSGFTVNGYIDRKKCINYPVQGTAFHCLLWCLIEIQKQLRKYRMKTKLIGQIHDDVVSDVPEDELENYIELAMEIITTKLRKHWSWIITPMRVEVETTPIGGNWYEKKEYKNKA